MRRRYSIAEARSSLSAIVDHVEAGGEIERTRRGLAVAVVVSLRAIERLRRDRIGFKYAYAQFLESCDLGEVGVDEDFLTSVRSAAGRIVAL